MRPTSRNRDILGRIVDESLEALPEDRVLKYGFQALQKQKGTLAKRSYRRKCSSLPWKCREKDSQDHDDDDHEHDHAKYARATSAPFMQASCMFANLKI